MRRFYCVACWCLALVWLSSCEPDHVSLTNSASQPLFNNDSACKALLAEYLQQSPGTDTLVYQAAAKDQSPVDFSDLADLFVENCVPCHQAGGNGPFELTSYEKIKRKSAVIRDVMVYRAMPPFLADCKYSNLVNAPRLSDTQRRQIVSWADGGTPNKKHLTTLWPTPGRAEEPSKTTQFFTASTHTISSNSDSYQCFVVDLHLKRDTFLRAIKYHSTNPRTIHHIMVFLDTSQQHNDSPACWDCFKQPLANTWVPIDSWSKGMTPVIYNNDFAMRLPKGSRFILQTHYGDEGNKGQVEKTTLELSLCARPQREVVYNCINNLNIFFPANSIKTESIAFKVDSDLAVLGGEPHLHFLAKRIEIFAITPKLQKIKLLKINNWDYLWQGNYMLSRLAHIPAGSTIYMNAVFDNTTNNLNQPNNPVVDVKYDNYSNQEMMVLCLYYTRYQKGDSLVSPYKILRH